MARKSRRFADSNEQPPKTSIKVYATCIYARLSSHDNGKEERDSIENQISMMKEYIKARPNLELSKIYADNGATGTNFDRPQFNEMMDAVKSGEINCIVVKDLSRFGRNYIETGNYLEKIFPFLGVRFISVNDNFDSINPDSIDGLAISLKSLMNDIYAKDISKKVSSSIFSKQSRGDYIGNYPPYGYLKSPENKYQLIVDSATAPIVADIFNRKLSGMSNVQIARRLNELKVPCPGSYRYQMGISKTNKYENSLWQQQTIKSLLKNPVYTGCISQRKHKGSPLNGHPRRRTSPDEWINVEGRHEAIVDKDTFETVNKILADSKQVYNEKTRQYQRIAESENIFFKGLLYCNSCGSRLIRHKEIHRGQNSQSVYYTYVCQNFEQNREMACESRKSVSEKQLKIAVSESIQTQIKLIADFSELCADGRDEAPYKLRADTIDRQANQVQARLAKVEQRIKKLYDDYSCGILDSTEYSQFKERYKGEKLAIQQELLELDARPNNEICPKVIKTWSSVLEKSNGEIILSKDLLSELIEKIVISDKNTISIKFKHQDGLAKLLGGDDFAAQ